MTTKGGFQFDATITLGSLLTLAAVLISVIFAWARLDARLTALELAQSEPRIRALEVRDAANVAEIRSIQAMLLRIERKLDNLSGVSLP
jgi:hypothetical protein